MSRPTLLVLDEMVDVHRDEHALLLAERALLRTILRYGLVATDPDDDVHVLSLAATQVIPAPQAATARRVIGELGAVRKRRRRR